MKIVILILAAIFCVVAVFVLNWFWKLLAIPMLGIIIYDLYQSQKHKKTTEILPHEKKEKKKKQV